MSKSVENAILVEGYDNVQEIFAERLKECMRIRHVTSMDVQRATGISHSAVSAWILLKRTPRMDALCKMAEYFDCSVDYLLGRNEY